jgi:DNA polymerase-3 subunit beta
MEVSAFYQEGSANRKVAIEMTGEPIKLSFNAKFILDYLAISSVKKITIHITSSIHPAVIKPADEEFSYLYLIMPIHV